jgi:sarcosine oxidase subunit beta
MRPGFLRSAADDRAAVASYVRPDASPSEEPFAMDSDIATDVVVIGAGAIGASTAHHLTAAGLRVVVVDALEGPAAGSTGRSFASVRVQWADPLNIELSWRSIQTFREFPERYGVDVGYRPKGYLLLVPEARWAAHLEAVDLQRAHGVPVEVLDVAAGSAIVPFEPEGLAGASWGPADGVVDPHLVASAYLDLARRAGAQVFFRSPVRAVDAHPSDGGWTVTAGNRSIRGQHVVNAAGGWAGEVAALAGLAVPVSHSKRNVYATAAGSVRRPVPITIDLGTGIFLRSEGDRLLFGASRADQPDGYDLSVDWPWMETVLAAAGPRFPWLLDMPLDRGACWAGTYENTPDRQGILGPHPDAPTWVDVCGLSGHGLMQSPELGRLAAEAVTTGSITSMDAGALRVERFASAQTTQLGLVI